LISFYDWCKRIVPNAPEGLPLTADSAEDILGWFQRSCLNGEIDDEENIEFFCNIWNQYVRETGQFDQLITEKDVCKLR